MLKKTETIVKAIVKVALLSLLAGCGGGGSTGGGGATVIVPGASPTAPPLVAKIGVIAPLQAGQTSFGVGIRNSVQLAVDQANASGTLHGIHLVVDARDDSSTPSVGAAAATSLAQDPTVVGVVGTYNSGVAAQVAPILKSADIVEISPANTDPTLTLGPDPSNPVRPNFNYFRMVVPDSIQGPALATYAYQQLGVRRVAVVTESKSVSKGLADAFVQKFTALGGTILVEAVVPAGTTDYTSILQPIAPTSPELLFYGGEYNSGGTTVRVQSRAVGMNCPMMGGDGLKDDAYIQAVGAAGEGDYASTVGAPLSQLPGGTAFLAAYRAEGFGDPPTDFGPYAFDAANTIIASLRAGTTRRGDIIANVQAFQGTGVTGPIGFDAFGDTTNKVLTIYKVVNGAWVPQQTVTQ